MTEVCTLPLTTTEKPSWRYVTELSDLVAIFETGVQVCIWRRKIDPAIETYLKYLNESGEAQEMEVLTSSIQPKLGCLPEKCGRASLVDDLSFLSEIMQELLGCDEIGMRFACLKHAMCPGWHFDRLGIRLVCTYQGPGTQWLDDQGIDRYDLGSNPGEIVLLKGSLWQGNETFGVIHRSPELEPNATLRALATLDPLWRD